MKKYGVQMFGLRDITPTDLRLALKTVADIGYKYVEFAGFFGHSAEEVRSYLDEFGASASDFARSSGSSDMQTQRNGPNP